MGRHKDRSQVAAGRGEGKERVAEKTPEREGEKAKREGWERRS